MVTTTRYRTISGMLLALRRLRRRETWTRSQLDEFQNSSLARLRSYAYERSPFYRGFHAGLADRPLCDLPVLTKSMLNKHYDDIVTDPQINFAAIDAHAKTLRASELFLDKYIVCSTSGTTGTHTHILYNRNEWATVLASFTRFERHIGSFRGAIQRPKMAVVASSTPWHMSARIFATIRSSWLPILRLDVGEPLEVIVQKLNEWQPEMLATYASMAGILAEEQASGRLHIRPRRIVSSAEVMSTPLRRRIQAVWGDIVFDQYGATEGGTFAVECDSGHLPSNTEGGRTRGMHLFEDLFIIENVDNQNRPVAPGCYGDKLLLTVLYNYTQPLIRYELSDSLRMSTQPCTCGCSLALIDDIQGRREEVLQFPNVNGGTVSVHPMVFYRILDAAPVKSWQVVQVDNNILLVRLSGNSARIDNNILIRSLQDALERQKAKPVSVKVEWLTQMERNATGKMPRIISRCHEESETKRADMP